MPRSLLLVLALLALAATAAPASAATRPDVRAFTKATLAFDLARGKAIGRAERRGDQRRDAAAAECLDVLRAAPAGRRNELFALYFVHVSAGYFAEDEPIFARWIRALKRVPTRDPVLRRARTSLGAQLTFGRRVYAQGRAFCAPVRRWAAARWATGARPEAVRRLRALDRTDAPDAGITAAARLLRAKGGAGGALAGSVLLGGVDEPDTRVVKADDPVAAALAPGSA